VIDQIKIELSDNLKGILCRFLRNKILGIREGLQDLYSNRIVTWRRAYEAEPISATRDFPFHGASNIIIPVIAIHSDTLLARVMAAIFKTVPIWTTSLVGDFPVEAEDWRIAFERHMQYIAIEPTELDLYRVYHEWCGEAIRYGTSTIKCPVTKVVEDEAVVGPDGLKTQFITNIKYEGSRPEKIPFTDFGISPDEKTTEDADFKFHVIHYKRHRLEELAYIGIYDKAAVKEMLTRPDRTSPSYVQQSQEQDAGAYTSSSYGYAEYDVYECHFKYKFGRHYMKAIAWFSESTNQLLRIFYRYYPDDIFITARLFYRDDYFFGYGFAETLSMMQEEISVIHNQRRDNSTVANTMLWRVDPDSDLHKGYQVFPGACVPARDGEIEGISPGAVNPMTIDEERMSWELTEKRSGVSAPIQGSGSGAMEKRGVYSSMGTLSLLQEGNTRTDLNITDIRYAHTKIGRIVAKQEAEFFSSDSSRYRRYGKMGSYVAQALQAYKAGLLTMPVYAATASVNREVEKQSDLMLTGMMQKHYGMITEMLQSASNQFADPRIKGYLSAAVDSANSLMKSVFRHFGYDEVDRYVPPVPPEQAPPTGPQGQQQLPPGAQPTQPVKPADAAGGPGPQFGTAPQTGLSAILTSYGGSGRALQ
jgi:hypothetical protein